ncbi:MAG: MFS transporter [Lachnospiraceae bacterium]|nr:MFS transporter [Lachnospiraceae bacterium]
MRFRLHAGYGGTHAAYWAAYAAANTFASAFLLDRGYTNSQIGLILATANLIAICMQPLLADLADRSQKVSLIGMTQLANTFIGILLLLCLFIPKACLALSVIYVMLLAWQMALRPLFNSLSSRLEESGYKINFGATRSMGSLSFAIVCGVLGGLSEKFGTQVFPITGEIFLLLLMMVLFFLNRTYHRACGQRTLGGVGYANVEGEKEIDLLTFIRRNRLFLLVNVGGAGIFFSNTMTSNFMLQIVESIGGTSGDMGTSFALMAFLEMPPLIFFEKIHQRISNRILLEFGAVCFAIKIVLLFFARSVPMLHAAQCFQLTSFGIFLPAMVSFIDETMEKGERVKGQALYTMMMTLASIFASLVGGFVLEYQGVSAMLLVCVGVMVVGAVLFIMAVRWMEGSVKARGE